MRRLLLLTVLAVSACRGSDKKTDAGGGGDTGGTLVISVSADAHGLLPVYADDALTKAVVEQLYSKLADIGNDLNSVGDKGFVPRLADRWEWAPDSLSIAFHIDPRARWADGRPVTARDVAFTYSVYRDPKVGSATSALLESVDSVTVRDSATAVAWYSKRTPKQFFDVTYQLLIMPEHLLGSTDRANLRSHALVTSPVGNGRFKFVRWTKGSSIEIIADTTHYLGRPKLDRIIWTMAPDLSTGVTRLLTGEADFFEYLRPDNIEEIKKNPNLKLVPYPSLQYGFMSFNLRDPKNSQRPHPIFSDREMRRALTMAVDRASLVKNVFGEYALPAVGPVPRALGVSDNALRQIPFDVEASRRLLDSLGWTDADGDGVRQKGNRRLEFSLLVPSSSKPRAAVAVLLQEAFRQVGVKVNVELLEFTTVGARLNARNFESTLGVWQTDPSPGGLRQTWGADGTTPGRSNQGSYVNRTVNAIVDTALSQMDPAREREYFLRAYQLIIDDAPAIWLYEPRVTAGAHKRIMPATMRADVWWSHLAEWSIPADQRIDRDRIGLRAAPAP